MIHKNNFINLFSLAALFSISIIFLLKYLPRYSEFVFPIALGYSIFFFAIIFIIDRKVETKLRLQTKNSLIIFFAFFAVASIAVLISPAETQVGRIDAINAWLTNFQKSIYPYRSEVNPSGFPFLFFLASPFYLLGEAGIFSAFGFALMLLQLKLISNYKKEFYFAVVVFLLLPSSYYELLTKSDLLTNSVLLIGMAILTLKFVRVEKIDLQFFIIALLAGLFAATRMISFLVLFTLFIFHFRNNLKNGLFFLAIAIVAFALVSLPFIFWDYNYFIERGPFAIQSLYLPLWVYFVFPFFILYFGWSLADEQEYFFFNGIMIFLLVVISFLTTIGREGFHAAYFESRFDISYFILSVPFFLLSLKEYEVDRFLGKIYPIKK